MAAAMADSVPVAALVEKVLPVFLAAALASLAKAAFLVKLDLALSQGLLKMLVRITSVKQWVLVAVRGSAGQSSSHQAEPWSISGNGTLDGTATGGTNGNGTGSAFGGGIFYQGTDGTTSTLNVGASNQTFSSAIADYIGSGGTNPNGGATASDQGGSLGLTKSGGGTLTLAAANTYTGGTLVAAGTLQTAVQDAIDPGTAVDVETNLNVDGFQQDFGVLSGNGTIIDNGTATQLNVGVGNASSTFTGLLEDGTGTLSLGKMGTGTFILTNANTYTGTTTISAGTLQLGNGGTKSAIANTSSIVDNGTLAFDHSDTETTIAQISGTGSVTQIGSGTTILTANNTYTGSTTITAGTLQLGNGGTFSTINGTSGVIDNGALVFDHSDVETTNLSVSGTGSLRQIGSGTTILTNNSTYTGTTTISAGTLQLGNGGFNSTISGTSAIVDNGALVFDRADSETTTAPISGNGSLSQIGSGTTVLTGTNTYTGSTTISTGTLQLGNGGTTGSIDGTSGVLDNGRLVFDHSDTETTNLLISGTGSLVQGSLGTTILTNNSTYTGTTTIIGTLQLGNGGFNSTISGTSSITDNGSLVFDTRDTETTKALISGNGAVSQIGSGTTILSGNNTYSGGTTIYGGTLDLTQTTSAGSGGITFGATGGQATGTLALEVTAQPPAGSTFGNALANFTGGATLDLKGFTNAFLLPGSMGNSLTVYGFGGSNQQLEGETFTLDGNVAPAYMVSSDGNGGTFVTAAAVCFAAGTQIRTARGDVAVEHLAVGDLVTTASGTARLVVWLGHRMVERPREDACPVRIRGGAFGANLPERDLLLSPGHPVLVGADEDNDWRPPRADHVPDQRHHDRAGRGRRGHLLARRAGRA